MGKVVLNGSENYWVGFSYLDGTDGIRYYRYYTNNEFNAKNSCVLYCDNFKYVDTRTSNGNNIFTNTSEGSYPNGIQIQINPNNLNLGYEDINGLKQWLQQNPTTVVYELAEPYYEDITPIQNEFVITSIGESSFTIDSGAIPTDGEITYSVNVKLLNDLEESINNNTSSTDTDLSTILDDIINE
jgi:hypothetical protein